MTKRFSFLLILLVALAMLVLPAYAATNKIDNTSRDVFIGEEGLDISAVASTGDTIAWFASGTNPNLDAPNDQFTIDDANSFYVSPSTFEGRIGNWYLYNGGVNGGLVFNVVNPILDIKVWDNTANKDVTNKQVTSGNYLSFRVETNVIPVTQRPGYGASDSYVTIKVRTAMGQPYNALCKSYLQPIYI